MSNFTPQTKKATWPFGDKPEIGLRQKNNGDIVVFVGAINVGMLWLNGEAPAIAALGFPAEPTPPAVEDGGVMEVGS